jgi:hypothetical protein
VGENHGILFLYVRRNAFIGSTNFPILQLQLEGGYDPLNFRLQPKGISNSPILRHQLEGGYNPLSLPRPTTQKYKCRQPVTTTESINLLLIYRCHYHNLSLLLYFINYNHSNPYVSNPHTKIHKNFFQIKYS